MSVHLKDDSGLSIEEKRALLAEMLQERTELPEPIPLSFAQQRLWFLQQLQPDSSLYHIPLAIRLRGGLNFEALRKSLSSIVARHDSLRTTFRADGEAPVQQVNAVADLPMPIVDLSQEADGERRESVLRKRMKIEAEKPFDLERDLMLRATLYRIEPADHVLLLTIHHIAADEWSIRILLKELGELYTARLACRQSVFPAMVVQYGDYTLWQRERLQGSLLNRQLDYWKRELSGQRFKLDLPTDFPRPAVQSFRGRSRTRMVAAGVTQSLRSFGLAQDVSPFMTLLAVFYSLLFRYTGQNVVLVGSPIAGRTRVETEALIGFFVNTLVLRADLSSEMTFLELLTQVREKTLAAYAHQELPFERLVEELQPERSAGHMPLVQVMFAWQSDLQQEFDMPGLEVELIDVDSDTSKFDLTLVAKETKGGLQLFVEYSTDLFRAETIEGLFDHFEEALQCVIADPGVQLGRMSLLNEQRRRQLLVDWNDTARMYPRDSDVVALFEEQAQKRPHVVAVEFGDVRLTYADLHRRSDAVAFRLVEAGVQPEQVVGLCVERSADMVVGMLGILKAAAAYVPLDPSYPQERLAAILRDSEIRVLVGQKAVAMPLVDGVRQTIWLDDLPQGDEVFRARRKCKPESLAYVIYTSGSTGCPKGVMIEHRAIVRLVRNTDYVQLKPGDRVAQAANASFDAATFEIWGPLLNGGTIVGLDRETVLSPSSLAAALKERWITALFLTTALFNQIASEAPEAFSELKYLLFGGEAVDPKWVRRILHSKYRPERLLHVYGPTESTTFATWHSVTEVEENAKTIPIGRPIANTTLFVLDSHLELVPPGAIGEVFVGGDGLARGYWRQPELTESRFINHPFQPGARLYRTGDLGRFRCDGALEFIGRVDHQVKVRGFRVELGEIETALLGLPQVKECVIVALDDEDGSFGGKRLVAYVVLHGSEHDGDAVGELRAYLKAKLPDYMVPAVWEVLESMPINANGKIDRAALPKPRQERPELKKSYVGPRDEFERTLVKIWEKVLNVCPVGVRDNFFELGGHSLLAVRLFVQIEKQFLKKLPLATLFQSPTIEKLAKVVSQREAPAARSLIVEIQATGTRRPIFWIHSLGGDGGGGFFYYRKLSQILGPDQPSYGIRSPLEPFKDIEKMAEYYVNELVTFQPEGPYYLGGFCFGGNVAYEMARQLSLRGEKVALLALLESAVPLPRGAVLPMTPHLLKLFARNCCLWWQDLIHQPPGKWMARIARKCRTSVKRWNRLLFDRKHRATPIELADVMDMSGYPKDYVKYAEAHWEALLAYRPQRYPGKVTLFRARKQPLLRYDPCLGWDLLAEGGVSVNVIPGNHDDMLQEPNVHMLAAELRACLAEAQVEPDRAEPAEGSPQGMVSKADKGSFTAAKNQFTGQNKA